MHYSSESENFCKKTERKKKERAGKKNLGKEKTDSNWTNNKIPAFKYLTLNITMSINMQ